MPGGFLCCSQRNGTAAGRRRALLCLLPHEAGKHCDSGKKGGYDYFTTTLSVSPYKNAQKLNEIGRQLSQQVGVSYLCSDFKKRNGYKRSIELSREYGLYRQNYCGCVFSQEEARRRAAEKEKDGQENAAD